MKKFVTWYLDNSRLVFFLWICLAILVLVLTKSMFCATLTLILCILVFMLFDYLEDSSFLKTGEENNPDSKYRWVRIGDSAIRFPKALFKD